MKGPPSRRAVVGSSIGPIIGRIHQSSGISLDSDGVLVESPGPGILVLAEVI